MDEFGEGITTVEEVLHAAGDIKAELRGTWESAAPGWAKWEDVLAQGLADVTDTMLDMAGVDVGMRVLDLACGAGSQSLRAADRVGPSGRVVASDISATMLMHVREAAQRSGLSNIETLECAAEDLSAAAGVFDAAISRLGLMLFPDPAKGLRGRFRSLRSGGRAVRSYSADQSGAGGADARREEHLLRNPGARPPRPRSSSIDAADWVAAKAAPSRRASGLPGP